MKDLKFRIKIAYAVLCGRPVMYGMDVRAGTSGNPYDGIDISRTQGQYIVSNCRFGG